MKDNTMKKTKSFTLIELMVAIAVIGLLATMVLMSLGSARDRAYRARGLHNRRQAISYCAINPGVSTLHGDTVYCDSNNNMWSVTLNAGLGEDKLKVNPDDGDDQFLWAQEGMTEEEQDIVTRYGINDCNEVPSEDLHMFPACNACATLNYAGFSEGWRLPSQAIPFPLDVNCNNACARDGTQADYCAHGRQLWDFGVENCEWSITGCGSPQGNCIPSWDDTYGEALSYWSSVQSSSLYAWRVHFTDGNVLSITKSDVSFRLRCFLGQY